jgi:hypothetical protein
MDFEVLFQGAEQKNLEYGDPGSTIHISSWLGIRNHRSKSFIFVNHKERKVILINSDERSLFVDTYKAVRQTITSELMGRCIPLHCSSFSYGGQGIIFVGDKGSGKTTLLVASLLQKGRLASYLGNDRILARADETGVNLYVWPTVLGIGPGAIHNMPKFKEQMLPDLHDRAGGTARWLFDQELITEPEGPFKEVENLERSKQWNWPQKLWLTPMEVAASCNTNLGHRSGLNLIIYPSLNPDAKHVSVEEINGEQSAEMINSNILKELTFYPNWMKLPTPHTDVWNNSVAELQEKVKKIPAYKITGGPDTEAVVNAVFSLLSRRGKGRV